MDNNSANVQSLIPGKTLVDVRIGGEYEKLFWSLSVQNVFDTHYFEYAISALDFSPGSGWHLQRLSAARTHCPGQGGRDLVSGQ